MINDILRKKFVAVMDDIATVVIDKENLILYIALALLSKKNIFLLGMPGQSKSDVVRNFVDRIDGTKRFQTQLHEQSDVEQLFGILDIVELSKGNKVIDTSNMIPEANIVVLDEAFKGKNVFQCLLTAMNEREYTNYGTTVTIPAYSFICTSNEMPDLNNPEEKRYAALVDRLEIKVMSGYVNGKVNQQKAAKVVRERNKQNLNILPNIITKDELEKIQDEIVTIEYPESIDDTVIDIVEDLRNKGIQVTDRRWLNAYSLVRAWAYLAGRDKVELKDLEILKNYFWDRPTDIETVKATIERFIQNPMKEKIDAAMAMGVELFNNNMNTINNGVDANCKTSFCKKFRKEILRVYDTLLEINKDISSEKDKIEYEKALSELEDMNKKVTEGYSFTHVLLKELKSMM